MALNGFATTQRTVIVSAGVNVDLSFTAKVAGVAETVTVDAETPVIDTKKVGTGTTISREELTMIPNSRDPWAFMRAVPGVQIDRVNQAGSESGQQSGFIGKGSSQTDAMWVLDGIVITDPAAVGASPTYFDFDAFDEVAITTGGADVRVATGGVGINLVTKRGTNAFHGGVSGFYASEKLEASNLPSELEGDPRLQGSDKADHAEQLAEYGFELGGPIIKDRLWFWGSYGKQDLRIQRLTQTRDKTRAQGLQRQDELPGLVVEHALGVLVPRATRSSSGGPTAAGSGPRRRRTRATRAASTRTATGRTASSRSRTTTSSARASCST